MASELSSLRTLALAPSENASNSIYNSYYNPLLNGALHWLRSGGSPAFICCFDFVSEQFGAVPESFEFSPLDKEFSNIMQVCEMNGNLSICDHTKRDRIAIWVMKDYGVRESWSKDIVIDHMIYETGYDTYESVMIKGSGEILVIFNNNSIMLYDPKSEAFESELKIFRVSSKFNAIAHVPSLTSLKDVAKGENLKILGSN